MPAAINSSPPRATSPPCLTSSGTAQNAPPLDVARTGDAEAAVAKAETFGGLDIFVNNAGFGLIGAIEETEPEEYRSMFETNLFGVIETTRAAPPALRQRRGGRIINFSSVGGITGRQGFGLYNASKFAVESFSEALAEEVAPFAPSRSCCMGGERGTDGFPRRALKPQANFMVRRILQHRSLRHQSNDHLTATGTAGYGVIRLLNAVRAEGERRLIEEGLKPARLDHRRGFVQDVAVASAALAG